MASSLSNLVNNLAEGIHKTKCKYKNDDKKCEKCGIKYKNFECFLEYTNFKDNLIKCKCLSKKKKKNWWKFKEMIFNTYSFSNHNVNKFILLLQKCVYPYAYIDDWEKFSEI